MSDNQQLLSWAAENLKVWDEDYTHLRSDNSSTPLFFSSGEWEEQHKKHQGVEVWNNIAGTWKGLSYVSFKTEAPQVITEQEWLSACENYLQSLDKTEETKVMSELFGKKYKVTPETSELLQLAVFEAGGTWGYGCKAVQSKTEPYLYVSSGGRITYGYTNETFKSSWYTEATLEVVKSIKIKEVIPAKTKEQLEYEKLQEQIAEHEKTMAESQATLNALKEQVVRMKP